MEYIPHHNIPDIYLDNGTQEATIEATETETEQLIQLLDIADDNICNVLDYIEDFEHDQLQRFCQDAYQVFKNIKRHSIKCNILLHLYKPTGDNTPPTKA